jgi:hypothetical protein
MITCNECSKNFNSIVSHVRKHNLTPKQYLEKYPNSPLMSEEQKNKISSKTKEAMANPQTRENYLNSRKAIDYSKIKPIYDRTDKKIKERQYSKERNEKVSEARKKYWEDKKGKTVEELYGEEKGKEIRKNKSIQTSGENNPAYGKVYTKIGRKRGYYKGYFFRSLWEYSYLKFLEFNKVCLEDVEYEKILIKFKFKKIHRTYRPDFYLKKENKLIEIKSKYHLNIDNELINVKKEAAEKWCLENNSTYHILTEDDFPIFSYTKAKEDKDVVFC